MCDSETCAGEPEKRQAEQLTLEAEFNKYFTVFDGSSPEDVSHAKQLWTSLSLLPLLESRLISADISQRLPVAKTNHGQRLQEGSHWKLRQEEKQRYMDMAKQRLEIISLLHQQRQNRIQAGCLPPQGSGNRCGGSPKASVTHTLKHAHLHTHSNMHIYTHINKIQNTTNHKHDPKYYQI
ncbi:UPF0722 protein C11orf88 homolog isoform X5 [Esox lucius]|uniref:UPF0722 protein C11orf88 homolog isoform X5 n=1 Tax=Esox lucius TaxID=8010 RepID=UPI0010BDC227|nr:UPF0722 protein C11orf88 homolog isoform X5 [Esox lucius]